MPMSNPAARQGHAILRAVLTILSIGVLLVCMLMWWMTAFDTLQPVASSSGEQAASSPQPSAPE